MAKVDGTFLYIGTYAGEAAARDDYAIVKDLHTDGAVGTYDAAVITKDSSGKVHVNKDEMATPRRLGWRRSRGRDRHSFPARDHRLCRCRWRHRRDRRSPLAWPFPIRCQGTR